MPRVNKARALEYIKEYRENPENRAKMNKYQNTYYKIRRLKNHLNSDFCDQLIKEFGPEVAIMKMKIEVARLKYEKALSESSSNDGESSSNDGDNSD